jgi:methionine synthase II (cobalamin-independent)
VEIVYPDEQASINDLCDIFNAELRELAVAGCPLIQIEEPPPHGRTTRPDCTDADLEFLTEAFNRQLPAPCAQCLLLGARHAACPPTCSPNGGAH